METEQIKLSDGRTVTMREVTGMDVMIASKLAKDDTIAMAAASIACSITEIDGKKFERPQNLVSVQAFMREIKAKDFTRLSAAYGRLNGDEEAGEAVAAE